MTFLEAPQSIEEMALYCREVDGPKLANMIEGGLTPVLPPVELKKLGYRGVAAYPLTLLSASVKAMKSSLQLLKDGKATDSLVLPFKELQRDVGFEDYYKSLEKYI
jgi:2-methylisocitrate lyase-like PEP mutase family enzyme